MTTHLFSRIAFCLACGSIMAYVHISTGSSLLMTVAFTVTIMVVLWIATNQKNASKLNNKIKTADIPDALANYILYYADEFTDRNYNRLDKIVDLVDAIHDKITDTDKYEDEICELRSIVLNHLPTTIDIYLRIPRVERQVIVNGLSASSHLRCQLAMIKNALQRMLDDISKREVDETTQWTKFLQNRYTDSTFSNDK